MLNARGLDLVMVEVEERMKEYLEEYTRFWEGDRGNGNEIPGEAGGFPARDSREIQYNNLGDITG